MAVLHETFLSIAGTDYTALLRRHSMPQNNEVIENNTMGSNSPSVELGLYNTTLGATLKYSAALETALADAWAGDASVAIIVRRHSGAASATNFQRTITGALESYGAIMGEVGALHEMEVTIQTNSDETYVEA